MEHDQKSRSGAGKVSDKSAVFQGRSASIDKAVDVFPGQFVDCSANPFDLRPAVAAIMTARSWILNRIPDGVPLVILMGESHDFDIHQLLENAVIRHVHVAAKAARRTVACGVELPCDVPQKYGDCKPGYHDLQGLHFFKALKKIRSSPDRDLDIINTCVKRKISICFNDVAWEETGLSLSKRAWLDQRETSTRDLVMRHRPHLLGTALSRSPRHATFPDGIALSNLSMAEKAIVQMRETGAVEYVQILGLAHILGGSTDYDLCKHEDSLSVQFARRGCAVLRVFIECIEHTLPPGAEDDFNRSVRITGLSRQLGNYEMMKERVNKASSYNL